MYGRTWHSWKSRIRESLTTRHDGDGRMYFMGVYGGFLCYWPVEAGHAWKDTKHAGGHELRKSVLLHNYV